jgi:uncharacterized protein involved in oxidation of intracellular sulfur
MKALFILNDAPHGSERTYNGLWLADALAKKPDNSVRMLLMGDAMSGGKRGQKSASWFYNADLMLNRVLKSSGEVKLCATCMMRAG